MSLSKGKLSWFFPSISSISSCKSVHLGVRAVVKFASQEDWLGFCYSLEDDTQLFSFFFVCYRWNYRQEWVDGDVCGRLFL